MANPYPWIGSRGDVVVPQKIYVPPPDLDRLFSIDEPENVRSAKRTIAEPSTSSAVPSTKKKRAVVDDDDCIDLCSSSESSDDEITVLEPPPPQTTQSSAVNKSREKKVAQHPNLYLAGSAVYNEATLLGVTEWEGSRDERTRVEAYKLRFPFDEFDKDIWDHYKTNRQDDAIFHRKMAMRISLLQIAQQAFPHSHVRLLVVGSTINGCGSFNSDMDLCLVVTNGDGSITEGSKGFANKILRKLCNELRRNRRLVKKCEFINARVSIIKMETVHPNSIEVDINLNNLPGVYNSHLMHYYSRVDDRFSAICLIVKHWAIKAELNDAPSGTLNSYSLILLVLHFLQCGVVPAILPNLQHLYPERFAVRTELNDICLYGEFSPPLPWRILNEQSVGEILVGFFQYYSRFNFETTAISIKKGRAFPRSELAGTTTRFAIFIEEPFEGLNTARCVRREYMESIRAAFQRAAMEFKTGKPDLKDIDVQ